MKLANLDKFLRFRSCDQRRLPGGYVPLYTILRTQPLERVQHILREIRRKLAVRRVQLDRARVDAATTDMRAEANRRHHLSICGAHQQTALAHTREAIEQRQHHAQARGEMKLLLSDGSVLLHLCWGNTPRQLIVRSPRLRGAG